MKKSLPIPRWGILLALTVALASACDQGAIFYAISKEIKPKDPVVEGTPSKMVEFGGSLYVANGDLWSYDGSSWSKPSGQPSGAIRDVAATTTALYVLTLEGSDTALYKSINGTSWTQLDAPGGYPFLQSIYGAGTTLFVGARASGSDDYAVYYDNAGTLTSVKTGLGDGGLLVGAVRDGTNFYVATRGAGIFAADTLANLTAATAVTGSTDSAYQLNGLIQVGTEVVAVGAGGYLLHGTGSFTPVSYANVAFTGALSLWDDGTDGLLLIGYKDTDDSYTFGYREIALTAIGGDLSGTSLQEPGTGTVSSVADNATYVGSLGKKVVNHLFQTSLVSQDGRTLFAATQLDGLWSYRTEWNAED